MADNSKFISSVESIFKGMDTFISTKTVIGEPIEAGDAIIIPLVDISCGMAVGNFADAAKYNGGGGMSAKMSPAAVLIIQNGVTKLVNVKSQDALIKILDMIPDVIAKFTSKKKVSAEVEKLAREVAESEESTVEVIE